MQKNDIIEVKIIDMGTDGEGIGKLDAFPFFIKDAIIGDTVRAKIIKLKKNYAYARLIEVIKPSEYRITAPCSVAKPCGGCQIQSMDYKAQLSFKEKKVFNNLMRIGGVDEACLNAIFEPIVGMDNPWRYRNKAQYPISADKNGKLIAGFYAGRTHSVIECEDCLIGPASHRTILDAVLNWMDANSVAAYDENTGTGIVRHVLIREGFATGQTMVVLVVNCRIADINLQSGRWKKLSEALLAAMPEIDSIQLNENTAKTNVILGRECRLIHGTETIEDILCGLRFKISPLSFYQVNPLQTEKLYSAALEFANLSGTEEVWDICCGIGTITLAAADKMRRLQQEANAKELAAAEAYRVHGLEIVPQAIENAKENAAANGISNVEFICAAAEEYMPENRDKIKADVIITDPPRKGMDERALEVMVMMQPERIVYVSCDSATLARDVKYLIAHGYEPRRVRCFDLFPHSIHVESVCLLKRKC